MKNVIIGIDTFEGYKTFSETFINTNFNNVRILSLIFILRLNHVEAKGLTNQRIFFLDI